MLYTGRIYRIENIENENFYIGQTYQTLSQTINVRLNVEKQMGLFIEICENMVLNSLS